MALFQHNRRIADRHVTTVKDGYLSINLTLDD